MKYLLGLIVSLILAPALVLANEGTIAFVGATLIDGTDAEPLPDATLVITDGRIRAIGPRGDVGIPGDAEVIDVGGKFIMPGMVNAHGHVGGTVGLEGGQYTRENLLRQLGLYARYGVTTVNSLGGDQEEGFVLRNEQQTRDLQRARLFVAGSVINGDSEQAVREQVNRNADMGANWIKVRVDDNLGSTTKMSRPLFEALVDQAQARRLPVAVHLFYLEDAHFVLDAGADLIAHSVRDLPVDTGLLLKMIPDDICYVPTLTREVSTFVYESEPDFFSDPFFLEEVDPELIATLTQPERMSRMRNSASAQAYKEGLEVAMQNVAALHQAGVPVAMGTDSGPPARFQGYFEHMELSLMVEAGMTPLDAIRAATGVAAQCINRPDLGTLKPGNWGDMVILNENPVLDIANTHSIDSVWIAGNEVPGS